MLKRFTVVLDETLVRAVKSKAAKEGKTMTQVATELLTEYAKDELDELEELEALERFKDEWPI